MLIIDHVSCTYHLQDNLYNICNLLIVILKTSISIDMYLNLMIDSKPTTCTYNKEKHVLNERIFFSLCTHFS